MNKVEIRDFLFECLSINKNFSEEDIDKNFFELGYIDSFGAIELIEKLENRFEIKFTNLQFQDRRFPTVSGLTEIVFELKK